MMTTIHRSAVITRSDDDYNHFVWNTVLWTIS